MVITFKLLLHISLILLSGVSCSKLKQTPGPISSLESGPNSSTNSSPNPNVISSLTPSLNANSDPLNMFAVGAMANDVLATTNAHQEASQAAQQAVAAYSKAVATCQANVTCDQAKNQLIQVQSQQQVVSSAMAKIQSMGSQMTSAADKAKSILASIANKTNPDAVGAAAVLAASDVTNLLAQQTGITAQATANAVATCKVIVNVTCIVCPNAGTSTPAVASHANDVLNNIESSIGGSNSSLFG